MEGLPDDAAVEACIRSLFDLANELRIPPLMEFGIKDEDIPELVGLARKASSMKFNPVVLTDAALGQAIRGAVFGHIR